MKKLLLIRAYIICLFTYFVHILCTLFCNTLDTETLHNTHVGSLNSLFLSLQLNTFSFFPNGRIGLLTVGLQGHHSGCWLSSPRPRWKLSFNPLGRLQVSDNLLRKWDAIRSYPNCLMFSNLVMIGLSFKLMLAMNELTLPIFTRRQENIAWFFGWKKTRRISCWVCQHLLLSYKNKLFLAFSCPGCV